MLKLGLCAVVNWTNFTMAAPYRRHTTALSGCPMLWVLPWDSCSSASVWHSSIRLGLTMKMQQNESLCFLGQKKTAASGQAC